MTPRCGVNAPSPSIEEWRRAPTHLPSVEDLIPFKSTATLLGLQSGCYFVELFCRMGGVILTTSDRQAATELTPELLVAGQ